VDIGIKGKKYNWSLIMKVDFICTADWHTHWKVPFQRKDDFIKAQWRKIKFISDLQKEYKCPVLNAGDIFDTWKDDKDSNLLKLLYRSHDLFPHRMYCVYGQHEMPYHSNNQLDQSPLSILGRMNNSIYVLHNGEVVNANGFRIIGSGYGHKDKVRGNPNTILLTHQMVWVNEEPYPGVPPQGHVERVMEDNPGHRLIVSGDNHQPFFYQHQYRTLINPGSLMRRTVAQKDYRPSVVLWNRRGDVKRVFLPVEKDVWADPATIEVGGEEFKVLETIGKASATKDSFESNVRTQMEGLPHPAKLKVKKIMKETE
jgi:DNA repair exonuclease SbcCD nuclease subunit